MKMPINLASQPFRRDRAMIVASVVVCLLLMGTLGMLVSLGRSDSEQLVDARREVNRLNGQLRQVNAEQAQLDAVLRKPENAEVLERTLFINSLLMRKGISWTRILADLEEILPYNVKIVQIRPSVNARNQVALDMTLATDSPVPMIELLKKMGESRLFAHPAWQSSQPPTQAEPLFRYHVSVEYAQKL